MRIKSHKSHISSKRARARGWRCIPPLAVRGTVGDLVGMK